MKYAAVRRVLLVWFGIYVIAGVATDFLPQREVYPFFSWRLFDEIPNVQSYYTLRIYKLDGNVFDPPIWFADALHLFQDPRNPPTYHFLTQTLGSALDRGDGEIADEMKRQIDGFFDRPVSYEVVYITFEPLAFARFRAVQNLRHVANFSTE